MATHRIARLTLTREDLHTLCDLPDDVKIDYMWVDPEDQFLNCSLSSDRFPESLIYAYVPKQSLPEIQVDLRAGILDALDNASE